MRLLQGGSASMVLPNALVPGFSSLDDARLDGEVPSGGSRGDVTLKDFTLSGASRLPGAGASCHSQEGHMS